MKNIIIIRISIFSFLCIILIGCKKINDEANVEKAVSDLTNNFPQFRKGKSKQIEYYKLVRSVIYGENEFKLQLRSEPDSLNDPQKILVLINSRNQCCAIPFLSNTYREYWGFKNEKTLPNIIKTKSNFNQEFINALNTLKLNDTLGTGRKVITEMMFSLLNCKYITDKDSTEVLQGYSNENYELDNELFDPKTRIRFRKNYQEISKDWFINEYSPEQNSYYDTKNYRIYQIINNEGFYKKPLKLVIKCYRQNAIFNHRSI
ncbi:hypothetical protein J3S90_15645 [Flavobacterium sp. P4023]|uniref:Lipoprotein n=1 Tax=Flavobacterium flabelliforme TaxID=2816119 RepID=A0ABS5CX84_9FLAO|nr:hypothetical protein [Flavobacterium flabelliforme]MBP4143234.1 hypothetical protein [Flavobacterium flabelliforme]